MQNCFIKRYKRDWVSLLPIEFCLHDVWFYQLRHRLHVCLRALKRKHLRFIVDEKVKILHFHNEDKSWWSSILYNSVPNGNRHLYILYNILQVAHSNIDEQTFNCLERHNMAAFNLQETCWVQYEIKMKITKICLHCENEGFSLFHLWWSTNHSKYIFF